MYNKLNDALIAAVLKNVPEDTNPAQLLGDTLGLGREAAYRRLRREVPFTFGEAAMLGERLHFSLDRTAFAGSSRNVLFGLKFNNFKATAEVYNQILEQDIGFLRTIVSEENSTFASAGNTVSAEMYFNYETMANFKFYKWLYQHCMTEPEPLPFEDFRLPERLSRNYREYVAALQRVSQTCYIFDRRVMRHWVDALRTFQNLNLIGRQGVLRIRDELRQMLDDWEQVAVRGEYANGNRVSLYLSEVDLETSYSYLETGKACFAGIGIFSLNSLRTSDAAMFAYVKRWIEIQSRFSTLISRSGATHRIPFFRQQRQIVSELN